MSRLEKSRKEKQNQKKQTRFLLIALSVILVLGLASLLYGNMVDGPNHRDDLIDMERSVAYIDFFEITYVHVYLDDEMTPSKVLANEQPLKEDPARKRWSNEFLGYRQGEELTIRVFADNNGDLVQEESLVIDKIIE